MTMRWAGMPPKTDDWAFENGKERLWWAENATGHIFFTSPMSPLPPGFARFSTTNPKQMDRLFSRMHDQEREQNEKFLERLYTQRREKYDMLRSNLRNRLMASGVSDAEKNIIRASLKLMDERDHRAQQKMSAASPIFRRWMSISTRSATRKMNTKKNFGSRA